MTSPVFTLRPERVPAIFARVDQEEIGVAITIANNPDRAVFILHNHRPEQYRGYSVCRTADPALIFICRPGVELD